MHSHCDVILVYNVGLGFFLNGTFLSNNSIILLNEVGEGSRALYCLTDRLICCGTSVGGANRGVWSSPGTSVHLREDISADIYYSRGFSSLQLNRRSRSMGPAGVYRCIIPDASNVLWTLYIGLYTNTRGGKPKLIDREQADYKYT